MGGEFCPYLPMALCAFIYFRLWLCASNGLSLDRELFSLLSCTLFTLLPCDWSKTGIKDPIGLLGGLVPDAELIFFLAPCMSSRALFPTGIFILGMAVKTLLFYLTFSTLLLGLRLGLS